MDPDAAQAISKLMDRIEKLEREAARSLSLQVGAVLAVDIVNMVINVQSRVDGQTLPVKLEPSIHQQYVPVVGQQVILFRMGDQFTGILAYLGSRQLDRPLESGETLMEGSGGGMALLDSGGNIMLADSMMSNVLDILSGVGFQFTGDALAINIKNIGKIMIADDAITITKTTPMGVDVATAEFTVTDGVIQADSSKVELGVQPVIGAAVVSLSQVPGNYSFDLLTGRPIPGSTQVKANP